MDYNKQKSWFYVGREQKQRQQTVKTATDSAWFLLISPYFEK